MTICIVCCDRIEEDDDLGIVIVGIGNAEFEAPAHDECGREVVDE